MTIRRTRRDTRLALPAGALLAACTALAACGGDEPAAPVEMAMSQHADPDVTDVAARSAGPASAPRTDVLAAIVGTTEIPYPVYPNGRKYRVGGENGLRIVVFQTEDAFDEVDAWYRSASSSVGRPRLLAMTDYVRYPSAGDDADPWATHKPGIVIHEFHGRDARMAAGASASARTNIIMSY